MRHAIRSLVLVLVASVAAFSWPSNTAGIPRTSGADSLKLVGETVPNTFNVIVLGRLATYVGGKLSSSGFDTVATVAALDTATGFSTVVTDSMLCRCSASFASCSLKSGVTGTSNATSLTITTLPAQCRPTNTKLVQIPGVTNNSVKRNGLASVASTGVVTISKTDSVGVTSATFVNTGTKAIDAGVVLTFPKN